MARWFRRALAWTASLAAVAAVAFAAHQAAMRSGIDRMRAAAAQRLDIVAAELEADLDRFEYLPSLLEMQPSIFALLDTPAEPGLRDEVNRYLQGVNATAGASNLYVLDRTGMALAAADWNEPGTPVGTDLSFRPYVKEALTQGRGRFYGVGITSKRAGYFLSYALRQDGRVRGVATVKIDLESSERAWRNLPGNVVVVDERGVVILSSRPDWKFRPLAPLSAPVLAEIASTRPYGDAPLQPLDWRESKLYASGGRAVSMGGKRYVTVQRALRRTGWRLASLDDLASVSADAWSFAMTAALGTSVLLLLATVLWQRQKAVRQKLASRAALQSAYDSLEAKVLERTAELRATQGELVHAGRMAVLGQMSAGMVHELNQPLGALRTLSDNACVLLEQRRLEDVRGNLQRIAHLVDRLGRLTHQLKGFAYKATGSREPVRLRQVVSNAQFLVSQRMREKGVEMVVEVVSDAAVLAEESRLEQVLVNLLGNAIDAVANSPVRQVRVVAGVAGAGEATCRIRVIDTGPGIRPEILRRLFEPFVTSKPAGAGLGLGLMISAHIVREWGGSLRASNLEGGGACFEIELAAAAVPEAVVHE
jgi:two-component system, NtrC family, C4-dicarboxylate transport sensor histidine kinase DctB